VKRITFPITPVGKPRMTQRDKWKKRKVVQRWFAFKDELRRQAGLIGFVPPPCGMGLRFVLPMPESWSKKMKAGMDGKPHQAKPDKDNLEKAFLDALLEEDSVVWQTAGVEKRWGRTGRIEVYIYGGTE
jgi:Holliday junction resolvase RusA-like endonuclease